MSGRVRPNSGKICTHPKRERRRQRAAERLAEFEALSDWDKNLRMTALRTLYNTERRNERRLSDAK